MKFLNALEQLRYQNRRLAILLGLALLLNGTLLLGYFCLQRHLRIYLPPVIPESGVTVTQGEVPKSTIYSFTFYIWQRLNHWGTNGMVDYKKQINQLSPFLTAKFKQQLIADYNQRLNEGELQNRLRMMSSDDPGIIINRVVKTLNQNQWQVSLTVHLIERINSNAKIVKDTRLHYWITVVRADIDRQQNPWGLALAGFAATPQRVITPQAKPKFS